MRVTILCSDLSQNGLSRAYLLGEILARDHEVDMIGTTFGAGIWGPGQSGRFEYDAVRGSWWPRYSRSAAKLLRSIRGDVILAHKPLPSSYGIALLDRARTGRPVVLDIDDDELAFQPARSRLNPLRLASSVAHPNGRLWTRLITRRIGAADAITVATTGLQARHGGTLVPHAKDTDRLRPRPEWYRSAREELGVSGRRVVMFMGTPRPHKGVEDVAAALRLMRTEATLLVVGADPADPYIRSLQSSFPELLTYPPYKMDQVPFLLQAADAVVVPQRLRPEAVVQLPAKLLDAMALAKPVVATAVADIPSILAEGRGHVVPPGDPGAIARALDAIFEAPGDAARMGEDAREWLKRHGSYHSVHETLAGVLASAIERRRAARSTSERGQH